MLSTTTSRVQYTANGATVSFAVPFRFLDNTHLRVSKTVAGIVTIQTLDVDYTLTGAKNQTGGTCSFTVAPANGAIITILRDVPVLQLIQYLKNDDFPSETHEQGLDTLTMISQQLKGLMDRALQYPETEPAGYVAVLDGATNRINKLMGFDSNGRLTLLALDPVQITLTTPVIITLGMIPDGLITGAKINNTFDLTGKTVTLPNNCVSVDKLAGILDLTSKAVKLPPASVSPQCFPIGGSVGYDAIIRGGLRIRNRLRIGYGEPRFSPPITDPIGITITEAEAYINGTYVFGAGINGRPSYTKGTITISYVADNPSYWKISDSVGPTDYYFGNNDVGSPEQVVVWQPISGVGAPLVDLDTASPVLAVKGQTTVEGDVTASTFHGDGSALTNLQPDFQIKALVDNSEGSFRSLVYANAILTSAGKVLTIGNNNDQKKLGQGEYSNACNWYQNAAFGLGVDAIDGVSDNLNNGTDKIVSIKATINNIFALSANGILYAVGANNSGQLGQGDTTDRGVFRSIRFGSASNNNKKIVSFSISMGIEAVGHCMAIDIDGQVWLWGLNGNGELGINNTTSQTRPVKLSTSSATNAATFLSKVAIQVLALGGSGGSSYILFNDNRVWVTGYNQAGELGQGNTTQLQNFAIYPTTLVAKMFGRGRYDSVSTSSRKTFYTLSSANNLAGCGYNGGGELANGGTVNQTSPILVSAGVSYFSCGGDIQGWIALITTGGVFKSCGINGGGQLGNGNTTNQTTLQSPGAITTFIQADGGGKKILCAGYEAHGTTYIMTANGNVYAVGYNIYGQIGNGTIAGISTFAKSFFSNPLNIDMDYYEGADTAHGLRILRSDFSAWTCGYNAQTSLGIGQSAGAYAVPMRIRL